MKEKLRLEGLDVLGRTIPERILEKYDAMVEMD
jgi:hypothetical protein